MNSNFTEGRLKPDRSSRLEMILFVIIMIQVLVPLGDKGIKYKI